MSTRPSYFWVWARFRSFSCCIGTTRCCQVFSDPGAFAEADGRLATLIPLFDSEPVWQRIGPFFGLSRG
jgi:hypothetical protein